MTPLHLTPEDISNESEWEVAGTSPANSPQAVMQSVQILLQASMDPTTGLDKYALINAYVKHSPLRNAKVQVSKDELARRLAAGFMAQQAGAMAQPGGPGEGQPNPGNTGGFSPSPVGP